MRRGFHSSPSLLTCQPNAIASNDNSIMNMSMNENEPPADSMGPAPVAPTPGRVPLQLQQIFLQAALGHEIDTPPEDGLAQKVFDDAQRKIDETERLEQQERKTKSHKKKHHHDKHHHHHARQEPHEHRHVPHTVDHDRNNEINPTAPPLGGGRIPAALQRIFVQAALGVEQDKPPPNNLADKVFVRSPVSKTKRPAPRVKEIAFQTNANKTEEGEVSSDELSDEISNNQKRSNSSSTLLVSDSESEGEEKKQEEQDLPPPLTSSTPTSPSLDRIPTALQSVFLWSARGMEVQAPEEKDRAELAFVRDWQTLISVRQLDDDDVSVVSTQSDDECEDKVVVENHDFADFLELLEDKMTAIHKNDSASVTSSVTTKHRQNTKRKKNHRLHRRKRRKDEENRREFFETLFGKMESGPPPRREDVTRESFGDRLRRMEGRKASARSNSPNRFRNSTRSSARASSRSVSPNHIRKGKKSADHVSSRKALHRSRKLKRPEVVDCSDDHADESKKGGGRHSQRSTRSHHKLRSNSIGPMEELRDSNKVNRRHSTMTTSRRLYVSNTVMVPSPRKHKDNAYVPKKPPSPSPPPPPSPRSPPSRSDHRTLSPLPGSPVLVKRRYDSSGLTLPFYISPSRATSHQFLHEPQPQQAN